jgi:hypothetical protein
VVAVTLHKASIGLHDSAFWAYLHNSSNFLPVVMDLNGVACYRRLQPERRFHGTGYLLGAVCSTFVTHGIVKDYHSD